MPKKADNPTPKNRGGTDTLARRGLKQINALASPEEVNALKHAAIDAGLPLNRYLVLAALAASRSGLKVSP